MVFGEVSEEVNNLINTMAKTRLDKESMMSGSPGSEKRQGVIVGQLRRRLSLSTVRANTTCLLARLCHVGEGAAGAGRRRSWARLEEENMRKEREAVWRALVSGHSIVRRGRFCLG